MFPFVHNFFRIIVDYRASIIRYIYRLRGEIISNPQHYYIFIVLNDATWGELVFQCRMLSYAALPRRCVLAVRTLVVKERLASV